MDSDTDSTGRRYPSPPPLPLRDIYVPATVNASAVAAQGADATEDHGQLPPVPAMPSSPPAFDTSQFPPSITNTAEVNRMNVEYGPIYAVASCGPSERCTVKGCLRRKAGAKSSRDKLICPSSVQHYDEAARNKMCRTCLKCSKKTFAKNNEHTTEPPSPDELRKIAAENYERDLCSDDHFEELLNFKQANGHCVVPKSFQDNNKLGSWIKTQRTYKRQGRPYLTEEKIASLDAIGFVWDPREDFWELRFADLKKFKATFGHCLVPLRYPNNQQLGTWVNGQRAAYWRLVNGTGVKSKAIREDRKERLVEVGFVFEKYQYLTHTMVAHVVVEV